MVQLGKSQRFIAEMPACGWVAQRAGRKNFDGDIPGQMFVVGAIHFSHAAGADLLGDTVVAQIDADG